MNYTVYHLHTENSLLDSCTNYKLYVDKAVELGQKAICFTEHGNLYNWAEKKMYCDEKGIKYLHGIECYLTATFDETVRDNYHTILIAKNEEGFKELNRLNFLSTQKDHKYYSPRLSFDEFLGIDDNIIKISACVQSPLNRIRGNEIADKLLRHYDYYEIQYHDMPEQIEYNKYLYEMSKKYGKPLIAGTDTHSLNAYKAECRMLMMLRKGMEYSYEESCDLTYKSYDELVEMFRKQNSLPMDVVLEAIENTNKMADSVFDLVLDKTVKYPYLYGDDDEKVLKQVINKKYKQKLAAGIIDKNPQYVENIREEMRVFKKINMVGFMLFMSEMMSWCRENGIPTSPCRGSVGGSTIAYISDIIDVDPIKWHTVFSRFANEYREEVGDIDIDIYDDQRQLVYDYIINRFGKEKTAYILSMGTIAEKGCIDDIGGGLAVKWRLDHGLKKNDKSRDNENPYSLANVDRIKKEYEIDPESAKKNHPDLFYYFDGLLGTVVSQSQHPAGIIASPVNLIDNYSMFIGLDGQYILPINMEEVHEVGLVKYDILGLKNIGIIRKTCEYSHIKYPLAHEINWNDQKVFADMITSPVGIFQFEGDYAFKLLRDYGVHSVDDITLINAALRPSGESYRNKLIAHEMNHNPSKMIDDLLANSYGFLVYQEQTIAFLQQICGLSGGEADNVRRAIGRKQVDRLEAALPRILEGYCSKSDKPREEAEEEAKVFLKIIEDSSSYQFGFNHATGYSMVSYLCAYMRYYHTKEFICAYLNCANGDADIQSGTALAKERGIHIENPKFRKSRNEFIPDEKAPIIYKGVVSIKDMGKNNGDELYTLRDNHYDSFIDLLKDIREKTTVNSKQLDILIKLDFFSEFGDIRKLLKTVEIYNLLAGKKQMSKTKISELELPLELFLAHGKETKSLVKELDIDAIMNELISEAVKDSTLRADDIDKIKWQIELLGYSNLTIPKANKRMYVVQSVTSKKTLTVIQIYEVFSGKTREVKAWNRQLHEDLKQGDIIDIYKIKKENQKEPTGEVTPDGKRIYRSIPDKYEYWLVSFEILA